MENNDSVSLQLAKKLLNQNVTVTIDRKKGSLHPKWNYVYEVNYGYINNVIAPDGEELDAYVLFIDRPIETYKGKVVAIIHRLENDDDKLVVIPIDRTISDEEIEKMVDFQEKWFKHIIIRNL